MNASANEQGSVGENIRRERVAKGWSQRQLADAAKLTKFQVSRYETGDTAVTTDRLQEIADALGVSVTRLLP